MRHPSLALRFTLVSAALLAAGGACSTSPADTKPPRGGKGGDSAADGGGPDAGSGGSPSGAGGILLSTGGAPEGTPDACADCGSDAGGGCGDGRLDPGEACDDSNSDPGDGCSADCTAVDPGFICGTPGPCRPAATCGDGVVSGSETCDDAHAGGGDGCADDCQVEPGWRCPLAGAACQAAACGDGIVAGFEGCDVGTATPRAGCSVECQVEVGFKCPVPGAVCERTTCRDGLTEGTEECDDANYDTGDGCSPTCKREPVCVDGTCAASCGDGLKLDNEACDDGNGRPGDGCSPACGVEPGFTCALVTEDPVLPLVLRDFIGTSGTGNNGPRGGDTGPVHLDFEKYNGCREDVETALDSQGKPVLLNRNSCAESAASFAQWYRSAGTPTRTIVDLLTLLPVAGRPGTFEYFNPSFFPLDGRAWNDAADRREQTRDNGHNFHFTSELRYWFTYRGGERLTFDGDDDVWVFINRRLAVDIAGVHGRLQRWIVLPGDSVAGATGGDGATFGTFDPVALNLTRGGVYEVVVFQAERHTTSSQYRLTLENFLTGRSRCEWTCGDGIVTRFEVCDDGVNDGSYGGCMPGCLARGPGCGDATVQTAEGEECDDGVNLTPYGGCGPECKLGGRCGDGAVDALFGEQCDDGANLGLYGGCAAGCTLGPRCGDGAVQGDQGEACDDGNLRNRDGCNSQCLRDDPR